MEDGCVSACTGIVTQRDVVEYVLLGGLGFVGTLIVEVRVFPRTRQLASAFVFVGFAWIVATLGPRWIAYVAGLVPIGQLLLRPLSVGMGCALVVYGIAQFFSRRP